MSTNELTSLKSHFDSKHVNVSVYWLECCLKWFKEEYRNYTRNEMFDIIFDQWLNADLRDNDTRTLPPNLINEKKKVIDGIYAIQVMYVKDISRSSLSQLREIRNMYKLTRTLPENEHETDSWDRTSSASSAKRVLSLNLTDGIQYVNGFEYQPLPNLNLHLRPGAKILLKGPLMIQNGEFLLKSNNIEILGGEVEELQVCNCVENVLARELNMPENPNPIKQVNVETNVQSVQNRSGADCESNQHQIQQQPAQVPKRQVNTIPEICLPSTSNFQSNRIETNTNDFMVNDSDDSLFEYVDFDTEQLEPKAGTSTMRLDKSFRNESINQNHVQTVDLHSVTSIYDDIESDLELFNDIDSQIENENPPPPVSTPQSPSITNEPFVYIKHLLDNCTRIKTGTFRVYAKFLSCVEKLKVSRTNGWSMKFKIFDSSGEIIVSFKSVVIEKLIGLTPDEVFQLIENANKFFAADQTVQNPLFQYFENLKKKLEWLKCVLVLEFQENCDLPVVVAVEMPDQEFYEKLNRRILDTSINVRIG